MIILIRIWSLLHARWESDKVIFIIILCNLWPSSLWTPLTVAVQIRVSPLLFITGSRWESYSIIFLSINFRLPRCSLLLLIVVVAIICLMLVLIIVAPCEQTTHTLRLQLILVDLGNSWFFLETHVTAAIIVPLSTWILCLLIWTILISLKLRYVLICPVQVLFCLSQLSFKHVSAWFNHLNIAVSLLLFCFRFADLLP